MNDEFYHHGIKGQKWGIRRYQNSDGSLTPLGRRRYSKDAEEYRLEQQRTFAQERLSGIAARDVELANHGNRQLQALWRMRTDDLIQELIQMSNQNRVYGSIVQARAERFASDYSNLSINQMIARLGGPEYAPIRK